MGVSGTFRRADAMPRDEEDPLIRRADANVKEEPEAARAALYSARLSKLYMVYCGLFVLVTLTLIAWLTASIFLRKPVPAWVVVLDGAVTTSVVAETIVDMVVEGRVSVRSVCIRL
eukprot:GHVU01076909.1.p2 GENE.GHVU01076909.1~~GHVU01076909.1.p2  ORF type:complete len:116 (+),score=13.01 GHVU01076909.1:382-729(+)